MKLTNTISSGSIYILLTFLVVFTASAQKNQNRHNKVKDPIEQLAKKLNGSGGLWTNGVYPDINLPQSALPEEVVIKMFDVIRFDQRKVKNIKILTKKIIKIDAENYNAILVDTNLGRWIVLIKYERSGWWTKRFDTVDSGDKHNAMPEKLAKDYPNEDPINISWGAQKNYFRSKEFVVIEWAEAINILTDKSINFKGGKQYHSGWLTIFCTSGENYITKQPHLDAYLELKKSRGLTLEGFASE